MTKWAASAGEILDLSADALICSANVQLNLSGGVGGELLRRYGDSMQHYLHDWLRNSGLRYAAPGTVVPSPCFGSPYRTVLHAVAIDGFYDTSAELIAEAYRNAFTLASQAGCRTIVSVCLACGYGRATPEMLIEALRPFLGASFAGIDRIELWSTNAEIIEAVQKAIAATSD